MRTSETILEDYRAPQVLNILALLGISGALLVAFYYQLVLFDLPCPLCLLQRSGIIMMGLGFFFNLRLGIKNLHYALALLASLLTGAIAMRQVFLHIAPGDAGYGQVFIGLHFYTWAVLASILSIVAVACMLFLPNTDQVGPTRTFGLPITWMARAAMTLFVLLIAGNLLSTVLECGVGACADDPSLYQLLQRH